MLHSATVMERKSFFFLVDLVCMCYLNNSVRMEHQNAGVHYHGRPRLRGEEVARAAEGFEWLRTQPSTPFIRTAPHSTAHQRRSIDVACDNEATQAWSRESLVVLWLVFASCFHDICNAGYRGEASRGSGERPWRQEGSIRCIGMCARQEAHAITFVSPTSTDGRRDYIGCVAGVDVKGQVRMGSMLRKTAMSGGEKWC